MPHLSLIIPAYNEADRLPETLALVRDWVEQKDFDVEVLVVNDGSSDNTAEVVDQFAHRFPELKLLDKKQNQGKGAAVRDGMMAAAGDWRLFMDADGSTPIHEIDRLLEETKTFEIIIGSRYLEPGRIKIKQPLKRRIISRIGNMLIRAATLPGIRDTQCGFKLFSASATNAIFPKMSVNGWLFDVEILTIARQLGYAIKEVPVDWFDAKLSKLRAVRTGMTTLRELQSIRRRQKDGSYHNPRA